MTRLPPRDPVGLDALDPLVRRPPPLFCGFGGFERILLSSVGATRNRSTSFERVFLTIVAGAFVDIFNLSERADRGPFSSSAPFAIATSSILWLSPVFFRRLRRFRMCSSPSIEDVLRFLRTRDPSIGSSSSTSWLKTECESGFTAPR